MTETATRVRILRKIPVGFKLLRPSQDVKIIGVEDKPVRPVQVAGCHRDEEREENREPEVCGGPEKIVVSKHRSVEPPRRNA